MKRWELGEHFKQDFTIPAPSSTFVFQRHLQPAASEFWGYLSSRYHIYLIAKNHFLQDSIEYVTLRPYLLPVWRGQPRKRGFRERLQRRCNWEFFCRSLLTRYQFFKAACFYVTMPCFRHGALSYAIRAESPDTSAAQTYMPCSFAYVKTQLGVAMRACSRD